MEPLKYGHERCASLLRACWRVSVQLVVLMLSPMQNRPRGTSEPRTMSIGAGLVVVAALGVELVALWWLAYLVDLCISLMELWADLARKHLELTL